MIRADSLPSPAEPLSRINRIVIYRLLAAWVVISLLIGVAVSWLGVLKIDRELVTLAAAEMKKFAMANSALSKQPAAVRSVLDLSASQAIREHFIVGEFQDRDRRKLATAINPRHAAMTPEVERQSAPALRSIAKRISGSSAPTARAGCACGCGWTKRKPPAPDISRVHS